MICLEHLRDYNGAALNRGDTFLFLPPHALLRPYISNYTISFPSPLTMPDAYTILPTASSTLVLAVGESDMDVGLRGVNTRACAVGAFANRMRLLLLVEFRPGGLYPFLRLEQSELADASFPLEALDAPLNEAVRRALIQSSSIAALAAALDALLLARLASGAPKAEILALTGSIVGRHGGIGAGELSSRFYYSEKQLRRLFLRHVGTGPKTFSRIVRVNYALRLLQRGPAGPADIAAQAGYFDQPHLIRDFRAICGLTPREYLRNMSVNYNDWTKM